ncbi:hypothetical protein QUB69_27775 [Microcoleus sp. AT13-A6]
MSSKESAKNQCVINSVQLLKLRQLGLKDEQIAEVVGLALEVVKQID